MSLEAARAATGSGNGVYRARPEGLREAAAAVDRLHSRTAGVRRMMVDTGWLERDRAGSTYGTGRTLQA